MPRQLTIDSPTNLAPLISLLFDPLKLSITAPRWTDSDGVVFELPNRIVWRKPLGKRLCIIDIDTRPLNDTNEILNDGPLDWGKYGLTSAGMMGHYLYGEPNPHTQL